MPNYQFSSPESLLDNIRVITTLGGARRAFLHMREGASAENFQTVTDQLRQKRVLFYPAEKDGQHVLELREIPKAESFIDDLRELKLVNGTAQETPLAEEEFTNSQKVKNRTLNTAGWLYVLGDLALMKYAYDDYKETGSFAEPIMSAAYAGGTQMLLFYGKDQTSTRLMDMTRSMSKHIHDVGIDIPADSALAEVTRPMDTNILQKADRFLSRYPSEMMNAFFGGAGLMMMISAQHYTGTQASSKVKDTILGATTLGSGLLSALIKEKPLDPNKTYENNPAGWAEHVKDWIQAKPLRIAGYGYIISTFLHGLSTRDMYLKARNEFQSTGNAEFKGEMNRRLFRGAFVITNLMAEFLISLSSKGHGHGVKSDGKLEESAITIAADLVNRQTPEHQLAAEEHLATFLSHKEALAMDKGIILAQIRQERELLKDNPWAQYTHASIAEEQPQLANKPLGQWTALAPGQSKLHLNHAETLQANRSATSVIRTP